MLRPYFYVSMLSQEAGRGENGKPATAGKIFGIPSNDCLSIIILRLSQKYGVAERHLLGDVGCCFLHESAPPSLAIFTL
jgi:hypothetical protein